MTLALAIGLASSWLPAHSEVTAMSRSQAVSPDIRINQLGFYTQSPKVAVIVNAVGDDFYVLTSNLADTVLQGKLGEEGVWAPSNEKARLADFSEIKQPGQYVVSVPGVGASAAFSIGSHTLLDLSRGSIRSYYYQRASMNLEKAFAGKWERMAGHPDRRVYIHPSAASPERAAESMISSPGGWYDAGDYGKYVVNSGISTYTLLAAYREYSAFYDTLKLNIPESSNKIPDILDEALWNFRWMLTMQDPTDGGVYHKLTTADFSGMVMPEADKAKRYVVQKSVTATLDMAATAAYASRLFRKFEAQMPGLADSALAASRKAWDWARLNPKALYSQTAINASFTPKVSTGEYGDRSATDEFQWAGAELYLATKEDSFFTAGFPTGIPKSVGLPGWPNVATLGMFSMATDAGDDYPLIDTAEINKRMVDAATIIRNVSTTSSFRVPMATSDFYWGSNAVCGNQGMVMLLAYNLTGDTSFVRGAIDALDYLMGRNGTSSSYVTGYGIRVPMNPHHRPSVADDVIDPIPGLLVGGPNPGQDDKCAGYTSKLPAVSWLDTDCSYATNEVAINWNAPLVFLSGAMEAMYSGGQAGPQSIHPQGPDGKAARGMQAFLTWEGKAPRLVLPSGLAGTVEFFNMQGRTWKASDLTDKTGRAPSGLVLYRLRIQALGGAEIVRTGTWSLLAPLRIQL